MKLWIATVVKRRVQTKRDDYKRVNYGTSAGRNQPRTYLLNQSMVRCQARSAAALL